MKVGAVEVTEALTNHVTVQGFQTQMQTHTKAKRCNEGTYNQNKIKIIRGAGLQEDDCRNTGRQKQTQADA